MKPLDCARIEADLAAVAADEASGDAAGRVSAHVAHCEDCRALLQSYRATELELGALRKPPVDAVHVVRARQRLELGIADLRRRIVRYAVFPSPLGDVLVATSELGVVLVEYLRGRDVHWPAALEAEDLEPIENEAELSSLRRDLANYLAGRSHRLDWPLDLRLARSDFQREVLKATAAIPYGAVVSYKRLARDIGQPKAVRAVAQALRHNPVAIAIPCHRVIGAEGALVGYAGGKTQLKEKLLSVEGVPVERARGDYRVARESMYVLVPGDEEYCLPSCPSPENLRSGWLTLFGSREGAESAGYRPCTTCRPDLHPLAGRKTP